MPFAEVPAGLDAPFAQAEAQAPEYLGCDLDEARRLAAEAGIEDVRVLSLDQEGLRLRLDHRPRRLNLLVLDGEVVRAAFF